MQLYWILVISFLLVEADVTLSKENGFENSAHCEMTRDEDDEYCGRICYPIVKPLLRYAAICQGKDSTISELREKVIKLEGKLELAKSLELQASKQVEDLKVQLNLKEMLKHMGDLREQSDAKQQSWEQQLRDKDTELLRKENEILQMKDEISQMEKQTRDQARDGQMHSKDKSAKELEDQVKSLEQKLKDISEASSCLPFTNSTDLHIIRLPGGDPFHVPCNSSVSGSGWTVIQRRVNGNRSFNRTWIDYKRGFGNLRQNFFLGLERIHLMTLAQPHELYIQLGKVDGSTSYARFDDFKIGSEEEGYTLKSLGEYSGTAGDSLSKYHLNKKFSTWDREVESSNCPKLYKGGWWFETCGTSCLTGKYYEDGKVKESKYGVHWGSWHNYDYKISLTYSQMMIRPKTR